MRGFHHIYISRRAIYFKPKSVSTCKVVSQMACISMIIFVNGLPWFTNVVSCMQQINVDEIIHWNNFTNWDSVRKWDVNRTELN